MSPNTTFNLPLKKIDLLCWSGYQTYGGGNDSIALPRGLIIAAVNQSRDTGIYPPLTRLGRCAPLC